MPLVLVQLLIASSSTSKHVQILTINYVITTTLPPSRMCFNPYVFLYTRLSFKMILITFYSKGRASDLQRSCKDIKESYEIPTFIFRIISISY